MVCERVFVFLTEQCEKYKRFCFLVSLASAYLEERTLAATDTGTVNNESSS